MRPRASAKMETMRSKMVVNKLVNLLHFSSLLVGAGRVKNDGAKLPRDRVRGDDATLPRTGLPETLAATYSGLERRGTEVAGYTPYRGSPSRCESWPHEKEWQHAHQESKRTRFGSSNRRHSAIDL